MALSIEIVEGSARVTEFGYVSPLQGGNPGRTLPGGARLRRFESDPWLSGFDLIRSNPAYTTVAG